MICNPELLKALGDEQRLLFHSVAKSYYLSISAGQNKVTFKMQFSVHTTISDINRLMKKALSKDTFAMTPEEREGEDLI